MNNKNDLISKEILHQAFLYCDGNLFWKIKPAIQINIGEKAGTINHGYVKIGFKGRLFLAHRLIFMMHYGYMPKMIDHINRNPLDNRIENLREATSSQNNLNRRFSRSINRGVTWHKRSKKWQVRISMFAKQRTIGYFDDIDFACLIAEEARDKFERITGFSYI